MSENQENKKFKKAELLCLFKLKIVKNMEKFIYIKPHAVVGKVIWSRFEIGILKAEFIDKSGNTKTEVFADNEVEPITNEYWLGQLEGRPSRQNIVCEPNTNKNCNINFHFKPTKVEHTYYKTINT